MLLCKQGSRHQYTDLLAVLYGEECGAHRNLCFAKSHVTAHQSVHGGWACHVRNHSIYGHFLIGRCGKLKLIGERLIVGFGHVELKGRARLAQGIEV